MIKVLIAYIVISMSILKADDVDFFGHFGTQGTVVLNDSSKNYIGASAAFGIDSSFDNGIMIGIGGWASIPVYEYLKKNTSNIYRDIFVLSNFYFSYFTNSFQLIIGRYYVNNLGYEWLSGHNEGLSIEYVIDNFMKIWGFYSYRQSFQFIKNNRELYGQINSLWDFRRHKTYDIHNSHLIALGLDFYYDDILLLGPYLYYATNDLIAYGINANLFLGNDKQFYSNTSIKYVAVNEPIKKMGHLILLDQELGFDWFNIGGGYYKTIDNGAGRLTKFGDNSRFYGGVIFADATNMAIGPYFMADQETWYIFTGTNNDLININLLYSGGSYKELSAMLSLTVLKHLEIGAGYINLNGFNENRRDAITGFIKTKR